MTRISRIFESKQKKVFSVYFTAGYPYLDSTTELIRLLSDSGVDMLEIGIPFSDPLADGPVIQRSGSVALQNGMSIKVLFQQLRQVRTVTHIPLALMGYLNPVIQYGFAEFCKQAEDCGIDALIIPDLPVEEYREHYQAIVEQHHLKFVFLVTPSTSEERIRAVDDISGAFIYMVTSAATTGTSVALSEENKAYFQRIKNLGLRNPVVAGFGIKDKHSLDLITQYADGAIIGSHFVQSLAVCPDNLQQGVASFMQHYSAT